MNGPPELATLLRCSAIDALLPAAALPKDETPSRQLAAAPPGAPQTGRTDISDTGQLINRLLQLATQASPAAISTASKTLMTSSPSETRPAQIAAALQEAITTSGLFYESHLASWVAGQRSTASLSLEPQGQIAPGTGSEEADLPQRVKAQLDVMEKREAQWQGQAWPGMPITLSVQAHTDGDPAQPKADDDTPQWQSQMQLALPALGTIQARLHLAGERLQLTLVAGDAATVSLLRERAGKLAAALAENGTVLQQCTVSLDEAAPPHEPRFSISPNS